MGGLWNDVPVTDVASLAGFKKNPAFVWRFYSERRAAAKAAAPNAGHFALAAIEDKLGDRFLLATQNVDGLHLRAGNRRVIEMHGSLFRTRCARCDRAPFDDDADYSDRVPACGQCHARGEFSPLRPHIVWFGEALFEADLARIDDFLAAPNLVFLAVGTSGVVHPAAGLVKFARKKGAQTWLVNLEPPENVHAFDHVIQGNSSEVLPTLFAA
jgi:NAD-dependent deacetylase